MFRYRKRFYPRRKFYKRRFGYKKRNYKPLLRRVNFLQKKVLQHEEVKYLDNNQLAAGFNLAYNATTPLTSNKVCITNIPPGTQQSQRVGEDVKLKSLIVRYNINVSGTSTNAAAGACRLVIYQIREWSAYNTSSYDLAQFLSATASVFTAVNSPYSMQSTYAGAYKVLYDKVINLGNNKCTQSGGVDVKQMYQKYAKIVLRLHGRPVKYSLSSADSGAKGHIFMAAFGTIDSALSSTLSYFTRLKYTD